MPPQLLDGIVPVQTRLTWRKDPREPGLWCMPLKDRAKLSSFTVIVGLRACSTARPSVSCSGL